MKDIWSKIFGYHIGDRVRLTKDLRTLPDKEKGMIGEIVKRDKVQPSVYLVKLGVFLIWLEDNCFEKASDGKREVQL